MSLLTWKRQFAPMMSGVHERNWTDADAIEWSLAKWIGLRKQNLQLHGLDYWKESWIAETEDGDDDVRIDADTCPLCVKYLDKYEEHPKRCFSCPLQKILGKPCDEDEESPYDAWEEKGDPEPMIAVLMAAHEKEQKECLSIS
jgi:hypothetical protein